MQLAHSLGLGIFACYETEKATISVSKWLHSKESSQSRGSVTSDILLSG